MGNELTASLYTSVNCLERRHQDLFNCQNVKEIPFPCAGEIGDRHWYILPGFQYQAFEGRLWGCAVKLYYSGKAVPLWHRRSERFLFGLQ